jgi:O-antigen/teichoic acid export membrane protein
LLKHYVALVGFVAAILLPLVIISFIFPQAVIAILGPNYNDLEIPLKLYAIALVFWVSGDLADQLLRSRGLFLPPLINISIETAAFLIIPLINREVTVANTFASFLLVAIARLLRFGLFAADRLRAPRPVLAKDQA